MIGMWRAAAVSRLRARSGFAALVTVALGCVVGSPAWPACPPGSNQANCQGSEPQHQPQVQQRPAPVEQQHQPQVQQRPPPVEQQHQPQEPQRPQPVQQQHQPQLQQQAQPQVQQHALPPVQHPSSPSGTAGLALRPGPSGAGSSRSGSAPVRDSHAAAYSYHGQSYAPFRTGPYRWPNGMRYRHYGIGAYLPLGLIVSAYVIADWMDYGLAPPPPGYEWVRYGPDVLLVDPATGQIVDGAYSAFAESDQAPPPDYGPAAPAYAPPPGYAPQPVPAGGPQTLGNFANWVAAAYQENGQPVCYASTQALASTPPVPNRPPPVLTVTERATGRDAISISGILAGAGNAGITLQVGNAGLDFYPAGATVFANNGAAAVVAFQAGNQALVQSMSPYNGSITDTFSLIGFSAAYAAINAACPAQ